MRIDSMHMAGGTNTSIACQPELSSGGGSASSVPPLIVHNESEAAVVVLVGEVRI